VRVRVCVGQEWCDFLLRARVFQVGHFSKEGQTDEKRVGVKGRRGKKEREVEGNKRRVRCLGTLGVLGSVTGG